MNWLPFVIYLFFLAVLSYYARKKTSLSPEDFFLAGRSLGPLVLFFTLAATNFSAFFFLGFAGGAWQYGLGQYGIMGVGIALVPVSFYIIGDRVWRLGKKKGYLTAPELIGGEFSSPFLRLLVLIVMVVFTVPYLLTQAVGAGILVSSIAGHDVTRISAIIVILIICGVVIFGGMRGSAWTDVLQGGVMILAMTVAVVCVADGLGGFETAGKRAFAASPEHFMRPGPDNFFTPLRWFSFIILWSFVNPLFPQLFSRFYTARSPRSLRTSAWLYPLLVSFLFLGPVLIGVWARGTSLNPEYPDMILPLMVATFAPPWVHALVITGAVTALMSTADSQLLSLSSMLARDTGIKTRQVFWGRLLTLGLCGVIIVFLLIGIDARAGIFSFLIKTTFAGLIALTPATLAALYFPHIPKIAPILSILAGESAVFLIWSAILPSFGMADGIVVLLVSSVTLILSALDSGFGDFE